MLVSSRLLLLPSALLAGALTGCSLLEAGLYPPARLPASDMGQTGRPGGDRFPDVLAVVLRAAGGRSYDVVVTISSPYDSPQRYADGWRVMDPQGTVLGTHTLLHDHVGEQPFTRTQPSLVIPAGVDEVTVEGRDQAHGFGGLRLTVPVPES